MGIYLEDHKNGKLLKEFVSEEEVDYLWQVSHAVRSFVHLLPGEIENRSRPFPNSNFKLELDSMSRNDPISYSLIRAQS
jgi:hypothetical protein